MKHDIAVAYGDGIGPEIMEATLFILKEAGAPLHPHFVEIGEKVYSKGVLTGIEPATWDVIRHSKAFLKAPITTPQGGGFSSLNVAVRTTLGLFANIRPCVSYSPFVQTKHPIMDVVIVRENEEDLYAGIEYRLTPDVMYSHKLISRQGSEKIIRYAFEYARHNGRRRVTCFIKDNIMKFSDGLFHEVFNTLAKEYPDIENDSWIVDIGAAKLADTPEAFDVIVLPNLYGDILSDVAAQISGSVGLAGSANIGDHGAMFEAIHGSAPRIAGQNRANPSGLLFGAILMLAHLNEAEIARRIHEAWLCTIEEGIHTYDIYKEKSSKLCVGTKEFAQAVVKNLGNRPQKLKSPVYKESTKLVPLGPGSSSTVKRALVGVDLYIYSKEKAEIFQKKICNLITGPLKIQMISNRGARIWPHGQPETFCIEQWRCRFMHEEKARPVDYTEILALADKIQRQGFDLIKMENLYTFDGAPGFSSAKM